VGATVADGQLVPQREPADEVGVRDEQPGERHGVGGTGLDDRVAGRLQLVLAVTVAGERVAAYDVIADPARLAQLELAVLGA
jgi:hypothetical protein